MLSNLPDILSVLPGSCPGAGTVYPGFTSSSSEDPFSISPCEYWIISGILPLWLTWEEEDKWEGGGGGGVVGGGIGGVLRGLFCDNTRAGTGGGISFWLSSGVGIR